MNALDLPIISPQEVLRKRGIEGSLYNVDTAIICFRGRQASAKLIRGFGSSPLQEGILYHPQLYHSPEFNLLIVPEMVWGGPVTAILIEELFALGVRVLIGFGAGGTINPKVQPGTMFIARKAICRDGTSKEYSNDADCYPDTLFLDYYAAHHEKLEALLLNGLTTDSLYRETPKKIENWKQLGVDFINLEISPFYVVCKALGIRAIYVGLITDFVCEKWESTYWNVENEVDTRIIESIKELCREIRQS